MRFLAPFKACFTRTCQSIFDNISYGDSHKKKRIVPQKKKKKRKKVKNQTPSKDKNKKRKLNNKKTIKEESKNRIESIEIGRYDKMDIVAENRKRKKEFLHWYFCYLFHSGKELKN